MLTLATIAAPALWGRSRFRPGLGGDIPIHLLALATMIGWPAFFAWRTHTALVSERIAAEYADGYIAGLRARIAISNDRRGLRAVGN